MIHDITSVHYGNGYGIGSPISFLTVQVWSNLIWFGPIEYIDSGFLSVL